MLELASRQILRIENSLSKHAKARSQQRSISKAVIDALIDFGECYHDGRGGERYSFTKRSWRTFSAYLGTEAKHYTKYRSAYVVMSDDGTIITAGWRL
jgi:hypothetical protein